MLTEGEGVSTCAYCIDDLGSSFTKRIGEKLGAMPETQRLAACSIFNLSLILCRRGGCHMKMAGSMRAKIDTSCLHFPDIAPGHVARPFFV